MRRGRMEMNAKTDEYFLPCTLSWASAKSGGRISMSRAGDRMGVVSQYFGQESGGGGCGGG
jgi:hypothetical protein